MSPSWSRIGLMLGGIMSLCVVISNILHAVLPDGPGGSSLVTLLIPFLLAGAIGMIGGYSGGKAQMGAFAGLLAGLIGLVVDKASQVLIIVLLWPAIQHGAVLGFTADYQTWLQYATHPLTLGNYLNHYFLEDGIGFIVMTSLVTLTTEGLFATLGGMMGSAIRRTDIADLQPARTHSNPVGFILTTLVYSSLVWACAAELNALGGSHHLLGLDALGNTFTSWNGASWLIGSLAVIAFVLVAARRNPDHQRWHEPSPIFPSAE